MNLSYYTTATLAPRITNPNASNIVSRAVLAQNAIGAVIDVLLERLNVASADLQPAAAQRARREAAATALDQLKNEAARRVDDLRGDARTSRGGVDTAVRTYLSSLPSYELIRAQVGAQSLEAADQGELERFTRRVHEKDIDALLTAVCIPSFGHPLRDIANVAKQHLATRIVGEPAVIDADRLDLALEIVEQQHNEVVRLVAEIAEAGDAPTLGLPSASAMTIRGMSAESTQLRERARKLGIVRQSNATVAATADREGLGRAIQAQMAR